MFKRLCLQIQAPEDFIANFRDSSLQSTGEAATDQALRKSAAGEAFKKSLFSETDLRVTAGTAFNIDLRGQGSDFDVASLQL